MSSWKEVHDYIHANYKVEDVNDDVMKMVFTTEGLRSQLVFLIHHKLMGGVEDWVTIESPFAEVGEVDLAKALEKVSGMVCGGMSSVGNRLTIKHAIPLANLNMNELERPLILVVTSADAVEKELLGSDKN